MKAAVLARILTPHNQPVSQLSRLEGILIKTLDYWRSEAGISSLSVSAENTPPREWFPEAPFAVLVETALLSAHAGTEYCRRKGLYFEQIQQWKGELMQPDLREEKALINKRQKEIQQLNRELASKDKALLMLQKS